jgi:hypothetical protein
MVRIKNSWIEDDMDDGLGDLEDYKISVFIENIRQKGVAYEKQIFEDYLEESKRHHPLAYVGLGHFYRFGVSVPQNHTKAIMCYIKASGLGYKPILIHAARRFRLGEGVDIHYNRAVNCCFTCMDSECDPQLCYAVTSELVQIYSRINDSRFSPTKKDKPWFATVDERRVEVLLDRIAAELGCSFDFPLKHKRRTNKEIYLLNLKKLEKIVDSFGQEQNVN